MHITNSFTHNQIRPGLVVWTRFEQFESSKRDQNGNNRPHVIYDVTDDGVAWLVPLSTQGDAFAEKNIHHFIHPQACPVLNQVSWPVPHRGRFALSVNQIHGLRKGPLTRSAFEIVLAYIDLHDRLGHDHEAFVPFSGATYPVVDTVRFAENTIDELDELDILNVTPRQVVVRSTLVRFKKKSKTVRRVTNKALVRH